MSMGSRALKKSSNWRSKNLNEKKVSCECSGSILRKLRQKKLLRQKQFTHQSDSESLRSFNEKKNKTTSDSRAAISFSAPPKWRKINKKNRNRKRFSCFFNNTTKGRTFQFLMTISNARSPTHPSALLNLENECKQTAITIWNEKKITTTLPTSLQNNDEKSRQIMWPQKNKQKLALSQSLTGSFWHELHWSVMKSRSKSFHGWIFI